jgi:hypothetical protein
MVVFGCKGILIILSQALTKATLPTKENMVSPTITKRKVREGVCGTFWQPY